MTREELAWLAGYLEGEGSFLKRVRRATTGWSEPPKITVEAVDRDVIERAANLMQCRVLFFKLSEKNPKWHDTYRAFVTNKKAVEIMRLILPLMGKRRAAKIKEILEIERDYALINPRNRTACKNCGTPYSDYITHGAGQRACPKCRNRRSREHYYRRCLNATS